VVVRDGNIVSAEDSVPNNSVFPSILGITSSRRFSSIVVIEDIKPYSLQLSQQTIDTAKFIGEIKYCLSSTSIFHLEIPRSQVKEWVKLQYGYVVNKLLDKKVEYRSKMNDRLVEEGKLEKNNLVKKDGTLKAATFVWIDDRMVAAAMRVQWDIKKPKVGQKAAHGLKTHSWQALALATYYLKTF
jgi:hypothetical protein